MRSAAGMLSRLLTADITLAVTLTAPPHWVIDPSQVDQIVVSLAVSAREAMRCTAEDHTRPGIDVGMEFQGAVPMCGFGPGAYILALEAVHD